VQRASASNLTQLAEKGTAGACPGGRHRAHGTEGPEDPPPNPTPGGESWGHPRKSPQLPLRKRVVGTSLGAPSLTEPASYKSGKGKGKRKSGSRGCHRGGAGARTRQPWSPCPRCGGTSGPTPNAARAVPTAPRPRGEPSLLKRGHLDRRDARDTQPAGRRDTAQGC
jgi:hypothetical protein